MRKVPPSPSFSYPLNLFVLRILLHVSVHCVRLRTTRAGPTLADVICLLPLNILNDFICIEFGLDYFLQSRFLFAVRALARMSFYTTS